MQKKTDLLPTRGKRGTNTWSVKLVFAYLRPDVKLQEDSDCFVIFHICQNIKRDLRLHLSQVFYATLARISLSPERRFDVHQTHMCSRYWMESGLETAILLFR
ncbi:hypothetical protein AVEN_162985-1 [Araneus ventricosus]|uniref:Uncharacterized protein n=1 Tax=Araneus ventricosus TaxID=182803 RepID=A0A4Y2BZ61_ARAVE|nr:hypothetical protein AVEN_162985-1 [Araneus ventricosus]